MAETWEVVAMVHLQQLIRVSAAMLVAAALLGVSACAQQGPGGGSPGTPTIPSPGGTGVPGTDNAGKGIELDISVSDAPGAVPRTFTLVVAGATPAAGTTVPDPAAALAAVEQYGEKMFFPVPDPNRMCTEQYGGPEVATVTGWFKGRAVNATFKRTDGCEISRWQAMAPLLGAPAGGTGAI